MTILSICEKRTNNSKDKMRGFFPFDSAEGQNDKATAKVEALAAFAKWDFEGVYGLAVADAFELAVELGGRIVWVAVFFFVGGFGLALFESVVEVWLGDGLEGEQGEGEGGCGGVEALMVFVGGFFSAVLEALEEENGGEER
jgi:hypothetical protein